MEMLITIPIYNKVGERFEKTGSREYVITFKVTFRPHWLLIVVNGYPTEQKINLLGSHTAHRSKILTAISEYIHRDDYYYSPVSGDSPEVIFSGDNGEEKFICAMRYLAPIKSVNSRDVQSAFNLIIE